MGAKFELGIDGAMVIANPVPEADALAAEEFDGVIDTAIGEMNERGISGKETTPYLLARIAEKTGGRSLEANIALVLNNARVIRIRRSTLDNPATASAVFA